MLSEAELNVPAVVRLSDKPLGVSGGAPDRKERFVTLRAALDWIESELKSDPTLLVFGIDRADTGETLMDRYAYLDEMRSRGRDPV